MRRLNSLLATSIVLLAGVVAVADENELFSEFQSGSVYGEVAKLGQPQPLSAPIRIRSAEKLRDLATAAGFDAKVLGNRRVTLKKELSPWTFPVLLLLAEDEKTIDIVLGLTTIQDTARELPAETLLTLMSLSQDHAPAMFAFNRNRERTELSLMMDNSDVTGQSLRDEINRLAVIARKTSEAWASTRQKTTGQSKPAPESGAPAQPPVVLSGKWAASRSATEAFGVEFLTDGKFNLVYINGSSQSRSSGTFRVTAEKLLLSGTDGLKLEGEMTIKSATEFQFATANGSTLTFTKATQ